MFIGEIKVKGGVLLAYTSHYNARALTTTSVLKLVIELTIKADFMAVLFYYLYLIKWTLSLLFLHGSYINKTSVDLVDKQRFKFSFTSCAVNDSAYFKQTINCRTSAFLSLLR